MTFKLPYDFSYQMKTPLGSKVTLSVTLSLSESCRKNLQNSVSGTAIIFDCGGCNRSPRNRYFGQKKMEFSFKQDETVIQGETVRQGETVGQIKTVG